MRPANLRAILFDFDGTLADSYAAITASVNHVRASHGLSPLSETQVRRHVGRGPAHLIQHTVSDSDLDHDVAQYRAHHPSVMRDGTRLLPGAAEALPRLREAGFKLAVCSNKPVAFTRDLLSHLDLCGLFGAVLGPEDVARPKPAPDMLQAALTLLGVTPSEALYVGDMVVDIETARAAGVAVWVIPTGSDRLEALLEARPDAILSGFLDLIDRLV